MRYRSSLLGAALGILLLLGVIGFAVGLPEVSGGGEETSGGELPTELFPGELAGGQLVTYDEFEGSEAVGALPEDLAADMERNAAQGAAELGDLFGTDVAVERYIQADAMNATGAPTQLEVTVAAGEPGFFTMGVPEDPDAEHPAPWHHAIGFGDVRCLALYPSDSGLAQTGGMPLVVECQRGADGRTYHLRGVSVVPGDAAAALNEVVAHARAQDQ